MTMRKAPRDKYAAEGGMPRARAAVNEVWKFKAMREDDPRDEWQFDQWDDKYQKTIQTLELR